MVQITLNGNKKEIPQGSTIETLLLSMDLPRFFVVEKNLKIIYKEDYAGNILHDGDVIEIAAFCGGG